MNLHSTLPPGGDSETADALGAQTRRLLHGRITPMLLAMTWPNILIMLAQASTGLIETWWVAHLGTDALAGMALTFPLVMMMQMMSAGALGGGISSAIARALGSGRRDGADALVLHAIVINIAAGLLFGGVMIAFGRPIYRLLGGDGGALDAAVTYSNVVFVGMITLWVLNGLASVIRGTGNMLVPAFVICAGVVLLIPLSPLLIFGWGPLPGFGIAGGAAALVLFNVAGAAVLAWYILSGRSIVKFRLTPLRWRPMRDILHVGVLGSINTLQTTATIVFATAIVASTAGTDAVAGFGTAARLEYLLIPVIFGIGAPLVALVGTNIGAGQRDRALRIAFAGAALAFLLTEAIGLAAAAFPTSWLMLFSTHQQVIDTGSEYLRIVGPFYGFFGLGLALYFASQGAGRMLWPLAAGLLRVVLAIGGGWLAMRATGSLAGLYAFLAIALVAYGISLALAIRSGVWFGAAIRPFKVRQKATA